eukprot:NODE_6_length_70510_cov_1.054395.p11 type:complete len:527 gc:universal NODE_6_length_70510_cov_1.054395:17433-19013(+)
MKHVNFEDDPNVQLKINEGYAKKFEYNKKREELAYLQKHAEEQSSSDGSSEDEAAELVTDAVDIQIMNVIGKIRSKDPSIYDKNIHFFNDEHFDSSYKKSMKAPTKLKDIERTDILSKMETFEKHGEVIEDEPKPVVTYIDEQNALKEAFRSVEIAEDDFLEKKVNQKEIENPLENIIKNVEAEEIKEELVNVAKKSSQDWNQDQWLMNYVLTKGWMETNNDHLYGSAATYAIKDSDTFDSSVIVQQHGEEVPLYEDNSDDDSLVDKFEQDSQYRYQDKNSSQIKSYSRNVPDTARRPDTRRIEARKNKEVRKRHEVVQKSEQVKRLKNLKKEEILSKYKQISKAAGLKDNTLIEKLNLDSEFDEEKWDQEMEILFDDDYYNEVDELDIPESNLENLNDYGLDDKLEASKQKVFKDLLTVNKEELKDDIDEYFKLDYEDVVADVPVKFKYRNVEPENYGLKPGILLLAEEKDLNNVVGLKRIAPYKEKNYKVKKHKIAEVERIVKDKIKKIENKEEKKILKKWVKK